MKKLVIGAIAYTAFGLLFLVFCSLLVALVAGFCVKDSAEYMRNFARWVKG